MAKRRQRVGAYAVIVREGHILLSRLAPHLTDAELWTLPGGGIDHGEDPRDAVVREVYEETGLAARVGETARVFSRHLPDTRRDGRRVDAHSLRLVYEGWVPVDAPEPRVVEVDGSTVDAAWHPLASVLDGTVPVDWLALEALAAHQPVRMQRVAAYALVQQDGAVLLTRFSPLGFHTGKWGLPGGGVEHGEEPRETVLREVREETGLDCVVGEVITVDHVRVRGTAPSGRDEEFHSIGIVYAATVADGVEPRVEEQEGTTDAVAWVPVADIEAGTVPVVETVHRALAAAPIS
ncbi:MAG: NUDIX domain-containing protein [Actinomycetota bacterium]|nr:NUDIX domain-containing protein [Actinomycetota bacterium]